MQFKEFLEANTVANNDLFLIQKGDGTDEYRKIKSENLALNGNSSNSNFTDYYYRGDVEPVSVPFGFIWDEVTTTSLIQRWIKQPQGWQSNFYDISHGVFQSNDTSYIFRIDKRFDFLIHSIYLSIADYSEKGFSNSNYGLRASIFTHQYPVFTNINRNDVGEITTEGASSYQTVELNDYNNNGILRKEDNLNYLMMQTEHIEPPRRGFAVFKVGYSYIR